MKLAIASGKGGTGKTSLSCAIALACEYPVRLLDCDVEEPNCKIFIKGEEKSSQSVTVPVPSVDASKCNGCGKCSSICQFNAIIALKSSAMVFPELCHSCGGCALVCPTGAITEVDKEIGTIEFFEEKNVTLVQGTLQIGHAMSPPLIHAVKKHQVDDSLTILDSPPGTSCPVIAAVQDTDYVILVTEPTPFGLHDLKLAVETMRELSLPFGVVINRSTAGDSRVVDYCREEGIKVLLEIPNSRHVAEAYSNGETLLAALPELKSKLTELLKKIETKVSGGKE